MPISILMATVGLLFLLGGGEVLVRGAASLATCLGLSPLLIGLTVVAATTSMPELVVTVTSGIEGVPDLGVGNVIGSNIANILLVLGTAAIICPIATRPEHVLRDGMVLLTATVLFTAFAFTSTVGRLEGFLMVVALVVYLVFSYYSDRRLNGKRSSDRDAQNHEAQNHEAQNRNAADRSEAGSNNPSRGNAPGADPTPDAALQEGTCVAERPARFAGMMAVVFIITGVGALVGGSLLLIEGAVDIATRVGVSDAVIGLTLVAVGTSLPELATAIVAGLRHHSEIALGNVLGSNLFNLLLVLGVLGLIIPFQVAPEMLSFDIWVMVGAVVVLLPVMMTGWRIGRREGAVFLLAYGVYVAMKFEPALVGG
jgi:cation:H+ antiporter